MTDIRYTTPWGETYDLTQDHDWTTAIDEAGIDGLVGELTDKTITAVGIPGHIIDSQAIKPMTGTLEITVSAPADQSQQAADIYAKLRAGFSPLLTGTLEIISPLKGRLATQVRLAGAIPPPTGRPTDENIITNIKIPLIADSGIWWTDTFQAAGTVHITNPGDVTIWPKIKWLGPGGTVTLPSRATFTLPRVAASRTLILDNAESCVVLSNPDTIDYDTWRNTSAYAEGIPPNTTCTYTLPSGAHLTWNVGFLDPWRQ
ncbi:MAG: hypothetical protein Q4A82_01110 [Corynebacterium sp.]|nr:hypothetical protein [Corynebacterium sp.]